MLQKHNIQKKVVEKIEELLTADVREHPIKVVDRNTAREIINCLIFLNIENKKGKLKVNTEKAAKQLRRYNIFVSEAAIDRAVRNLKYGKRNATAATFFDNQMGTRSGKNTMYGIFYYICQRMKRKHNLELNYVGLPVTQLLDVANVFDDVVACEFDKQAFKIMEDMKELFKIHNAEILDANIIDFLKTQKDYIFNVFDLDLMGFLNTGNLINDLCDCLDNSMGHNAALCLVTSAGRGISYNQYFECVRKLVVELKERDINIVDHHSDGYSDRWQPMRYELMELERE